MGGSVLVKKSSFKMPAWLCASNKIRPWFVLWLCICKNLPFNHALNTIAMTGLMLLAATWNFYISYKNKYMNLHLQLSWTYGSSLKCLPIECFPLTYYLNGFKSRKKHLLTVGYFKTDFLYALIFLCFFFL